MIFYSVMAITSALVFYTVGVWSEKIQGVLKKWHLVIFWLGLFFDTLGTTLMSKMASGGFQFNFHGVIGLLAVILMFFHAAWATVVLKRNDEKARTNFHKLSLLVWLIWLIPYLSGAIMGMSM